MNPPRSGVILKTSRKAECVAFYRDILELEVLFEDDFLVCFAWGGGYLMVEPDPERQADSACGHLVLRFHVDDVVEEVERLRRHGIEARYAKFDWGEIASFQDPAGNKLELKDSASFQAQVRRFQQP
ncbi:MAG: VOC family protein [Fibrobacterota bacterium]